MSSHRTARPTGSRWKQALLAALVGAGMLSAYPVALAAQGPGGDAAQAVDDAAGKPADAGGKDAGGKDAGKDGGGKKKDKQDEKAGKDGGNKDEAKKDGGKADGAEKGKNDEEAKKQEEGKQDKGKQDKGKQDQQQAPNPNCTLIVPAAPLTATGLATPYRLRATNEGDGKCREANVDQSAFVEATIIDPASGDVSTYRPLVIDDGSAPAAPPVLPKLPGGAVVGIWFGYQGDVLTLRNAAPECVNGLGRSLFGQFAQCNAKAFFAAANAAIKAGKLKVPALGTGADGKPCPTVRDFSVVDQDQSDNVTTTYLALRDGTTAQDTAANLQIPGATQLKNGSDNGLLVNALDPVLGCTPFKAPDLTTGGRPSTSLALNELQAMVRQGDPVALVPPNDPMALVDDRQNLAKTNLYREGTGQPPVNPTVDTGLAYCTNYAAIAPQRFALDRPRTSVAPSPDPAAADNLFDFLVQRFTASWGELKCDKITGQGPPKVPGAKKAKQDQ